MKTTDKYVFFWNGIYSQWYLRDMVVDGIKYNCCEQYMMHQKALLFNDFQTASDILNESDPSEQKKLGRKVINFDPVKWNLVAKDFVTKGNMAKFTQNPDLKRSLLNTNERFFVEASPYDTIWGIGMHETDNGVEDPKNWKGTNWLGECLDKVKENINYGSI